MGKALSLILGTTNTNKHMVLIFNPSHKLMSQLRDEMITVT